MRSLSLNTNTLIPESRSASPSNSGDIKGKGKGKGKMVEEAVEKDGDVVVIVVEEEGEDDGEDVLIATLPTGGIVDFQKFKGISTLKKGQALELRRDHMNIADKWAIEVRYANKGLKIGFLGRKLGKILAPLLDDRLVETECTAGEIPSTTVGLDAVPITIKVFGNRSLARDSRLDFAFPERLRLKEAAATAAEMERKASSEAASHGSSTPTPTMDYLMLKSIMLEQSDRPSGDVLGELFKEGGMDPSHLPFHPCPPGKKDKTMRTDLMPFQKQGLAWMIKMEHPELPKTIDDPPVQLWVMKKDEEGEIFWLNVATESSQRAPPILKRGGILADEMGLGKTMQTIALICTDDTGEGVLAEPEEPDERYDDMTLIVCPLSVASNWTDQFHRHVGSKRLTWYLYHGEARNVSKKELRKYDVIITTYQTLALEHLWETPLKDNKPATKKAKLSATKEKEGTLHTIKWRRVVLDEGHLVKNPKAKMSVACADLKAERRWILTGTPIVNSVSDLGAMMTFLKLCRPLDQAAEWARCVEAKVKANDGEGGKLLRAIVSSTTLRRTKDMSDSNGKKLVSLPAVQFYLHKVKLSPDAQVLYDEVSNELTGIVKGIIKSGSSSIDVTHILVWVLRLRQLACDPSLCPQSFIDSVRQRALARDAETEFIAGPQLHHTEVSRLRGEMRQMKEDRTECAICYDFPVNPRITTCGHLFCASCIEECISIAHACPVDGKPLDSSRLVAEEIDQDEDLEVLLRQQREGFGTVGGAAKTQQLILLLRATEPGIKSLVFSQWTSHLNCIEAALNEAGIVTCRFDGSMTQQKREEMISSFSAVRKPTKLKKGEKGPPTVMLISLKAGALGLNLTCASQVFLMDPWWQASIEQQAIDRVNRIGQERSVKVFQMVAEGTVEDRVLEIQKRKEALTAQAFSGHKGTAAKQEKIESKLGDIALIFGLK